MNPDPLVIAARTFNSRLIVGTGKYSSFDVMQRAHEASGAEMVTVAVRRVNISDRTKESLLDYIDTKKIALLPNTAGCYSADDAIRTARLGREAGLSNWVKLEVIGDERTLFPDNEELLVATKLLVKEGFVVLPYTTDDPIVCRKLEACRCRRGDAAGRAHRLRTRHSKRQQHSHYPGIFARADHPRCGRGHGIRCDDRDGAGRRRCADEHSDRRSAGPDRDGGVDEVGRAGRPPRVPRRPHGPADVRQREQSLSRSGEMTGG